MSRVPVAGSYKVLAALVTAGVLVLVAVIIIIAVGGGSGTVSAPRPALAAHPGQTSSAPAGLPVVYSQVEGWHGGQTRPAAIYVGQGGAPFVKALMWPSWTAAAAQASGGLYMQQPGCTLPAYQCPYQRFRVKVQLSRVETHNGVRYYSRMQWTFSKKHVPLVLRWRTYRGYWRN